MATAEDRCPTHSGKLVDMFCGDHDVVCCSECVKASHKGCKSITYVSEAAKGVVDSKEFSDTLSNATKLKEHFQSLVDRRNQDMMRIAKERETALKSVEDLRSNLNDVLDKLESNTKDEIRKRFSKETDSIKKDVQKVMTIMTSLNGYVSNMETKAGGRPRIFANVKGAKLVMSDTGRFDTVVEMKVGEEKIEFKQDNHNIMGIRKLSVLGSVRNWPRAYKASYLGQHDIGISKDTQDCHVSGMVKLQTGEVVVADWNNKSIKLFDKYLNFNERLSFPSEPSDICCISPTEVAVGLLYKQKIQFVAVESKLRLTKDIYIDGYCRGLAFYDDKLFVASWLNEDDKARVLVYSLSGKKLRVIEKTAGGQEIFSEVSRIAVSGDGERIFVTDCNKGVIVLEAGSGEVVSVVSSRDWRYPVGVCMDDTGQAFICYKSSNTVTQIGPNGEGMGVVVGQSDGIQKPTAICYDVANCRILVAAFEEKMLYSFNLSF